MRGAIGKVLLGTAALTCPCHLPIYALVFGGTALGALISKNLGLAFLLLTAYFLISLTVGLKFLKPRLDEDTQAEAETVRVR